MIDKNHRIMDENKIRRELAKVLVNDPNNYSKIL